MIATTAAIRIAWVDSRSKPGVRYRATIAVDGTVRCSCPAATYGRRCWHRERVEALLAAEAELAGLLSQEPRNAP